MDGITYTWDANGNLLSDGVNSYTYDHANRLSSFTGSSLSSSYAYNGLGYRMQQTVNDEPENYLLDIASGLTQVLADGANTYLYGVDRITQQGSTNTEYFLGDALGSVRQLVDAGGNVTLAKGYEPYGEVQGSVGSGISSYGFTGEWTDGYIELVNLRSRYYSPKTGRFITKDSWQGNYTRSLSLNGWNYVESNPINRIDPSGYYGKVVHYDETLRWAKQIINQRCPNCLRQPGYLLSDWVAKGDLHVDDFGLDAITYIDLHFKTHTDAWEDTRRMINTADPYLFGAALHGLQDYWSHTYEGYPPKYPGHFLDSLNAGCIYNDCERPENEVLAILLSLSIDGVIESPTHEALKTILGYSSLDLKTLTTSNLFDIWLRVQPGPAETRKVASWKNRYGYDTDGYYPLTERDQLMANETIEALTEYFDMLNSIELCLFDIASYMPPINEEILLQLNGTR